MTDVLLQQTFRALATVQSAGKASAKSKVVVVDV